MVKHKNRKRYRESSEKNHVNHSHEKIIIALFMVFVFLAVVTVMNTAPEGVFKMPISAFAGKEISLNKTSFTGNEIIKGNITLTLEPEDIIPGNSMVTFSILVDPVLTDSLKNCPTEYVCPNGALVSWHQINSTTNECEIKREDPEGYCCSRNPAECTQVILNKDFDAGLDSWYRVPASGDFINVENVIWIDDEENEVFSNAAFEDSSLATRNTTYSLRQGLGTRKISINSLNNVPSQPITFLQEWFCNTTTDSCQSENDVSCPNSQCSNGACVSPAYSALVSPVNLFSGGAVFSILTEDNIYYYQSQSQSAPQGQSAACYDSDGKNYYAKGNCSMNGINVATDRCISQPPLEPISKGLLKYRIAWQKEDIKDYGCAFEIVVKGESLSGIRNLHYYYKIDNLCNHPAVNSTDKYIDMSLPGESYVGEVIWDTKEIDLYSDWTAKFGTGSSNDNITEIYLLSYTKTLNNLGYGQKVWLDYAKLEKAGHVEPFTECTNLDKQCCLEGTGLEDYLGRQLNCSSGYECWSKCTSLSAMKLTTFISISSSSGKRNTTSGDECQAIVDGELKLLHDPCYLVSQGGVGKGYTACLTNPNSGTCSNWDNTYRVDLSSSGINLKAPNKNGSYTLNWKFDYFPTIAEPCYDYDDSDPENPVEVPVPCLIFEKTTRFTVGSVLSCEENWAVINVTDCINNLQTVTEEDLARCPENSPTWQRVTNQSCGITLCSPSSYQCFGNIYQQCSQNGSIWIDLMDCNVQNQLCDIYQEGCYTPCTPNCEGVKCNSDDGCGGICVDNCNETNIPWMIIIIIVLVVIAIVVVLLLVLKKTPKYGTSIGQDSTMPGSSSQYPEVVSYIKDAVAAGAGKPDIKAKLLEAGWPNDVIDQSFRDYGM